MASCAEIVENAGRNHHSILHLNYQRLTCLPDGLMQPSVATVVKKLYLKRNLLSHLPPEISHLTSLVELYLHSNFLVALPPEIERLENLCDLDVSNNRLESLPAAIGKLFNLKRLRVSHNELTSLPDEIGCLRQLKSFQVMNNQISCLPASIAQCHNLLVLSVDHNRITSLPNGIVALTSLVELSASGNLLEYLPYDLSLLENLSALVVDNNPRLSWIPATVLCLPVLTTISMNRCNCTPHLHSDCGVEKLIRQSRKNHIPSLLELAARKLPHMDYVVNGKSGAPSIPHSLECLVDPSGHCWQCGEPFHREAFPRVYSGSEASNKLAMNSLIGQIRGSAVDFVLMFCSWTCLQTITDGVG